MCIFCNIINDSNLNKNAVYQDDLLIVIKDLYPKADHHYLVIPKKHIENMGAVTLKEDKDIIAYLFSEIPSIARSLNIDEYKVLSNSGKNAGQEVFHLHIHLLSGSISKEI